MGEIDLLSDNYNIDSVNAVITDDNIIPGVSGKVVNVFNSYHNMKKINNFNDYYLIYDLILPAISLKDNIDKYIISGNKLNRNISIIIDNNINIENYIVDNNIIANKLIDYEEYNINSTLEQINNDSTNFNRINKLLNNKLCLVTEDIEQICRKHEYYLIKPSIYVNNSNYLEVKNDLESGQIIVITDELELEKFKLLIQEIKFKEYNLVFLSNLIKE